MNFPFLKKEKFGLREQETFIGNRCDIYIPMYYLKDNSNPLASELGDRVQTMGVFRFKVDNKDWYELKLPLKFQFQFSESKKEKLKLEPGIQEGEYMVYTLHNGDAFVYDVLHKKDLSDLKDDFIGKMVEGAKIPNFVKYEDIADLFITALKATEFKGVGLSAAGLEIILSELCREKNELRNPFRKAYNGKNGLSYRTVRTVKLPELNSTFTSLLGEDISNQLVASILRQREGAPEIVSPVEKLIKY